MGVARTRPAGPAAMLRPAAILVVVAALAAACGSAATSLSGVGNAVGEGGAAPSGAPMAPEPASGQDDTGARAESDGDGQLTALRDEARVVYTGSMQLLVDDVNAAIVTASGIVRGVGGYVSASERSTDGESPVATITYRIPSDQWEDALDQLRRLGSRVAGEHTSSVEVTGQLVDLEARIRNLRASETALQAILSRAERIADVLEVQRELTSVRGEIERIDAQRAALEDQASYGTLAVTYGVELLAVVEASREWDPATEIDNATASLVSVLQGLATVAIWLVIVCLPILLGVAVLVGLVLLAARRLGVLRRATTPAATPGTGA